MISNKQIAHDLAIAYINNKYGPNVNGDFSVTGSNNDIYGSGSVETKFLPDVDKKKYHLLIQEKKQCLVS